MQLCNGRFACQNDRCRRILWNPATSTLYAHPAWLILILSLAPTIGLGIGRFAYALVLPDMRDALGWSYSAAGFMNTINAVGYLAGALLASRMIRRFGLPQTVRWGTLAAVASLALCAVSGNFFVLSFARLLAGVGAAGGFVGGAALAATIAQTRPERANFLLSLFYAGPGLGIISSGLIAPFVLQGFGPGSWWIVWWAMTLLCAVLILPLLLAPLGSGAAIDSAAPAKFSIRPVLVYLIGYFLFGAGYIAYMTFMIAYVRDAGGGAAGTERVLEPDRPQRIRDPMGVAARARARPRRPRHHDHPRRQRRSARRCRSSGIRCGCSRSRRWCSASPSSRWSAPPPPSSASTIRRRPGRRRLRR